MRRIFFSGVLALLSMPAAAQTIVSKMVVYEALPPSAAISDGVACPAGMRSTGGGYEINANVDDMTVWKNQPFPYG